MHGNRLTLSVIIPTYNNYEALRMALNSLAKQTYSPSNFEVIVIDDGSTDRTEELFEKMDYSYRCKLLRQVHKGANAARNLGIKTAKGDFLFFTGSDIIHDPEVLGKLMEVVREDEGIVARGDVRSWPHFDDTPFRRFMQREWRKNYRRMLNKSDLPPNFFAGTCSMVSKRYVFKAGLFDEELKEYGWQDIEFGYRLKRIGMKIRFVPGAISYHYHYIDFSTFLERMIKVGKQAVVVANKHPQLKTFLGLHIGNRLLDYLFFPRENSSKWIRALITFLERYTSSSLFHFLYNIMITHYYLKGVRERR